MIKKFYISVLSVLIITIMLTACKGNFSTSTVHDASSSKENSEKIKVVCTNFPEYDFVRQIAGDTVDTTLLLKPGAECHSYEPSPQDIIKIQNSNLFIYVGGDSDEWVSNVLSTMDQSHMTIFKLMDCVNLEKEELVEGMQPESEENSDKVINSPGTADKIHDSSLSDSSSTDTSADSDGETPEMDEHVWTSPANAIKIVQNISDTLCKIDPDNSNTYQTNTKSYIDKLTDLDADFRSVIQNSKRKEIIVGDRFPFRYFCDEYGLKYYAAFPGCSADTEPKSSTVAFLIDKVKEDNIPVVFHIELSNEQMCDSICEATGAKSELLNAVHNVSDSDFKSGATYISLMEHNVKVLKEALN